MGNSSGDNRLCRGLFGKTRQAVLALLYGRADSAFYTKQILDAVGAGRGTVQRELKNLTDSGIITRDVQGRQVYYRANDRCPIFNELKSIVRKTFGVADIISQSLAAAADRIQVAFIFGSIAGGRENRASDIDVMIVGDVASRNAVSLVAGAEEQLGREINTVVYSSAEFSHRARTDHHFVRSVLEGEKIFLIGDEHELAGLVG